MLQNRSHDTYGVGEIAFEVIGVHLDLFYHSRDAQFKHTPFFTIGKIQHSSFRVHLE